MATLTREDHLELEILPSVIRSIDEPEEEETGRFSTVGLKIGRWADRYAEHKLKTGYRNLNSV